MQACTDTSLVVSVRDTSAVPLGDLKAIVIHQSRGASAYATVDPAGEVTVATVVAASATPKVSSSSSKIPMGKMWIEIFADHISSEANDLRIHMASEKGRLLDVLTPIKSFVAPSAITFDLPSQHKLGHLDTKRGKLHVIVSSFGVASPVTAVGTFAEVARVKLMPGSFQVAQSAIGNRIELHGSGFGSDCTVLTVTIKLASVIQTGFVSGIHRCSDAVLVADLGSTIGFAAGTAISATVTRDTEFAHQTSNEAVVGYFAAALTSVPILSASAVQISSQSSGLFLRGGNFGVDRTEMRVYLSSSSGAWFDAHIETSNSTAMQVN